MARSSATSDEALAASTTKLAPERSKRWASRPAVALVSWPGNRRGFEWRQAALQIGGDRGTVVLSPLGVKGVQQRHGLGDHASVLKPGQVAAIEVVAAADHDLDAASCASRPRNKPGIGQRGRRGFEDQELLGLAAYRRCAA